MYPDTVQSSSLIFADYPNLFTTSEESSLLQDDLNNLMKWAELWELTSHYGLNNPCQEYTMNNNRLGAVSEECDLCVLFTKNLKFSQHICKKTY